MGSSAFDVGHIIKYHHGPAAAAQQQARQNQQALHIAQMQQSLGLQDIYFKKEYKIMKSFKEYLDKHRDMIFTIALVFLADHYLLKGALKSRLQGILENLLNKAEKKIHEG